MEALEVSRSGYNQWRRPEAGGRAKANGALLGRIVEVFQAHQQRYDSPRWG